MAVTNRAYTIASSPGIQCGTPSIKPARLRRAGVLTFSVLASLLIWQVPTWAHSWYPKECCHDGDCAPVDVVGWFQPNDGKTPLLVVTSKHGTVVIPREFPRQSSPDGRMHICIQGPYVMCLFMPPPL
jgi:hypothetical protein